MTGRIRPLGLLAVALAALALGLAACGSSSSSKSPSGGGSAGASGTSTTTGSSSGGAKLKVGVVTDIGGLNDHGFNHLAYVGLQRAEQQLGIQGRVLTSNSGADYLPNLTTLARDGYNLIIPVGFLMAQATDQVAKAFPSAKFAMVDSDATAEAGDPKNI
ncbi:MAG: BMP family ABC transporter substrate-binding protein, partial [Solirubrobacterales bacterium]|nr:BMP family ABC transporter substrate-binding protein [Solirubrobacterales bacterium]